MFCPDVILHFAQLYYPMTRFIRCVVLMLYLLAGACTSNQPNNPYRYTDTTQQVLYSSFSERPKHLDPAAAYSSNEYTFVAQIYEPPFQYHYLKRPYQLTPLTAQKMPELVYLDKQLQVLPADSPASQIAFTDYIITIKPNIYFQPHPALAKNKQGEYLYHHLSLAETTSLENLQDFTETGSRELIAEDYVYQIKRLANPKVQSPIAEMMKSYIVGFAEFSQQLSSQTSLATFTSMPLSGVTALDKYQYRIRIHGKYPQFIYWLAMPFFAPMPWEAEAFYSQAGLNEKNITLDWFPLGTGAYYLAENNPNRRMTLVKNPNFHLEIYPTEGESNDVSTGLLKDAGKRLPFIDKVVFTLEKETIPYWTKFLQGYYDASGIASDSFDQAIQYNAAGGMTLTDSMREKGIQLQTAVETSSFYMGFNMLDATVGGRSETAKKLRQAIAIAVDFEEFIAIFRNGRGFPAQGALPPGIFGYAEGEAGINPVVYDVVKQSAQRKSLAKAQQLMREAGYADGIDPKTNAPLILYFDTMSASIDDRPMMNWYRKQFEKLGITLVIRATDYNRFQEKMRSGNAQIFVWGWNADYPDPENFFFLLYGGNAKVKYGGENASNYQNPEFDRLFETMRNMDNSSERYAIIQQLQALIRQDSPWVFGFHPKTFSLYHRWYENIKLNLMANNQLKYVRIDTQARSLQRMAWNQPVLWPIGVVVGLFISIIAIKLGGLKRITHKK